MVAPLLLFTGFFAAAIMTWAVLHALPASRMVVVWRTTLVWTVLWAAALIVCTALRYVAIDGVCVLGVVVLINLIAVRRFASVKVKMYIADQMPEIQTSLFKQYLKARLDPETAARMVGGEYERGE